MRMLLIVFSVAFLPALAHGNCLQSINVVPDRVIPKLPFGPGQTSQFVGRSCGSLETERETLFVTHLAQISEATFKSFKKWERSRDLLINEIEKSRKDLAKARRDGASKKKWNRLKATVINLLGAGFTLIGCPTTWTGLGAVSCAGGISLAGYGIYDGLTDQGFQDAANEVDSRLATLRSTLANQKLLGLTILDEAKQAYSQRFKEMCQIVKDHCR